MDGHIQVYHGHLAHLGKKHVSRQRLCLPAMMEFWINNNQGLPYFFVTSQVSEMLQQMLREEIIPKLNILTKEKVTQRELDENPNLPRYTMVFDREGYSPKLFGKLWKEHRVAVITYRKNVKESWPKEDFTRHSVSSDKGKMDESVRYNKLKTESKHLQNIVKMICYRAETALVKSIIQAKADIIPDYKNHTLTVAIYSLACNRDNQATYKVFETLNQTETVFPNSNLKMIFKNTAG